MRLTLKQKQQIIENLEMVYYYVVETSYIVTGLDEDGGEVKNYTNVYTVTVENEDGKQTTFNVSANEYSYLAEQAHWDNNGQYIENEYTNGDIC